MPSNSLSGEISNLVSDLVRRRMEIKEDFIKAYIASKMPLTEEQANYVIQNLEMVEEWDQEGQYKRKCIWYFKEKKPTNV